jgi:LL-diaminopimelate aminotransferase
MRVEYSERLKRLPPYLFAEIEKLVKEQQSQGVDLISLSIGDPDLPPPGFVLSKLMEEAGNPKNHNYSFSQGEPSFRQAVVDWYKKRFSVDITPEQVVALIGSKEGIANVARAFINPGDRVLVPDPGYPVYANGSTILSDGVPVWIPLLEQNEYKPELEKIDGKQAKMMFLNYPNNPTAATVDKAFLKEIVEFAVDNEIILCYDNAYSEVTFDGYRAPSILEIDGALDVAIEFHSLSKTFNMTGDRIGFAVGNEQLINGLAKVKTQIDSGPPVYIQKAATKALASYTKEKPPEFIEERNEIYRRRRDVLVDQLRTMGFKCDRPKATFYVWLHCESGSVEFATRLIRAGVVVTPGVGFGACGENFVRFALTQPKERIEEACRRIGEVLGR